MNLDKDPESWARVSEAAVLGGSEAQRVNVLAMAKHDIAALASERELLRAVILNIQAQAERGFPIDHAALAAQCRAALRR